MRNSILVFIFLFLFLNFNIASAGIVPCGTSEHPVPCQICHLFVGVVNIVNFLLFKIAIPLTVIALIYGGIVILTSAGSEEKLKKGKRAVGLAVWGALIAFAAWLIINVILVALLDPKNISVDWLFNPFPDCPQ